MGIGLCPYSTHGDDSKTEFRNNRNNLNRFNVINQINFDNLIPKQIQSQMAIDHNIFESNKNNLDLRTVKTIQFKENNSLNYIDFYYYGEFNEKNEKDGLGKLVRINARNERKYFYGKWEQDELKYGVIYYKNNTKYIGDIKNYKRDGKGKYISEEETYEGDWKEDHKEGEGLLQYKDGLEYKGHFEKDKFNGKGEMKWPDGTYYSGYFLDNMFHGEGFLKGSNNHIYHGNFSKGLYNGAGEFEWTKGVESMKYKGNYLSGQKDGKGELYFTNGNVFRGNWESGTPLGEGIFETKNRKYYGNWRSGIFMQLIKVENKENWEEEKVNLNFTTPIEDIEIKGNFKLSVNSVVSSNFNTYNDVLIEVIKQNYY